MKKAKMSGGSKTRILTLRLDCICPMLPSQATNTLHRFLFKNNFIKTYYSKSILIKIRISSPPSSSVLPQFPRLPCLYFCIPAEPFTVFSPLRNSKTNSGFPLALWFLVVFHQCQLRCDSNSRLLVDNFADLFRFP
ncbi:hypothetical protein L2E82_39489 [Cichorium intybus]|uniref:Uncharacterized protein n=1 Tax=Cichorium intybus TaxID=13427 RepID=A0ACB9AIQ2_CICIN|nr:hypothetical protein L2E82_39489 [Cichorium intybus]